jgi:hypothetical protein
MNTVKVDRATNKDMRRESGVIDISRRLREVNPDQPTRLYRKDSPDLQVERRKWG